MSFDRMKWAMRQEIPGSSTRKLVLVILADAENTETGRCCPSVARIAEIAGCGQTAVKDALEALEGMGLIGRVRRRRGNGTLGVYDFTFAYDNHGRDQGRISDEPQPESGSTPQPESGSQNLEVLNQEVRSPSGDLTEGARTRWKVDRRPVTGTEEALARAVLDGWNERTDQSLRARDWLAKIIMRHREHPDLTADDHLYVIEVALQHRWWGGIPSPSVVYGNGALFDRCVQQARSRPQAPADTALAIAEQAIAAARGGRA